MRLNKQCTDFPKV